MLVRTIAFLLVVSASLVPAQSFYVGPGNVDSLFALVSDSCLNVLRAQRVLFSSRSWGNAMRGNYVRDLGAKYQLNWPKRYELTGGDTIPDTAFNQPGIVHFRGSDILYDRWHYIANLMRGTGGRSKAFGPEIDMAWQFLYGETSSMSMWKGYSALFDSLRREFPDVKFAICTHHLAADDSMDKSWNIYGNHYSDSVLAKYLGNTPVYDIRSFASIGTNGDTCWFDYHGKRYRKMCGEYATADSIHLKSYAKLEKGAFVLMAKLFCENCTTSVHAAPGQTDESMPIQKVVYQNPAQQGFTVAVNSPVRSAMLYDRLGRTIGDLPVTGDRIIIRQPLVTGGIYFLRINNSEKLYKMVFVK